MANNKTGNITDATKAPINIVLLFGVPIIAAMRVVIYKPTRITMVINAKIRFIKFFPFNVC